MVSRPKLMAALVLHGVFLLGAVVGVAATMAYTHHQLSEAFDDASPGQREHLRMRALARRLDLSDEQMGRIHEIVARHRDEREALFRQAEDSWFSPRQALERRIDAEIREVLTPEQRERFDHMVERREHRGARRRHR